MKIGNWQLERCTNKTTTSTLLGQILHCDGGRPIINGFSRILATLGLRNEAFDKWTLNCQENLFCFSGWLTFPYIDSYVWLFFGDHWLRVIKFVNHALLLARRPTDSSKWGCALAMQEDVTQSRPTTFKDNGSSSTFQLSVKQLELECNRQQRLLQTMTPASCRSWLIEWLELLD